ncbi:MAG: hypothetical protein IPH76_13745 [Xanthomonadales bacterium]|nr:hypothetical protein [Xanthomonadales bacterium]
MNAPAAPKPVGGLRERALTAVVLAPAAIAGVLMLPPVWFASALGLLFLIGVWEWTRVVGLAVAVRASRYSSRPASRSASASGLPAIWRACRRSGAASLWWCLAPWWLRALPLRRAAPRGAIARSRCWPARWSCRRGCAAIVLTATGAAGGGCCSC